MPAGDGPEERFHSRDGDLAAAEQNLANADHAGEQQRHIEMDERGGPVDPGDRTQAGRRLRPGHRLDVLLHEVQRRLSRRKWQPDGRKARSRRGPGGSIAGHISGPPMQDPAYARGRAIEPVVQRLPRPRKAQGEDGTERQEYAGHGEHVGVYRVGHRLDNARGSPDPEVLERVAEEEADERKQDTA